MEVGFWEIRGFCTLALHTRCVLFGEISRLLGGRTDGSFFGVMFSGCCCAFWLDWVCILIEQVRGWKCVAHNLVVVR